MINFGSDSFLGLDQDLRVQQAIRHGLRKWGTHNGSSRAFASVRANIVAEQRLADWLGVESTLDLPFGDAGQPGGDSRADGPPGRHRDGRDGAQLDAGSRQDRAGRWDEGRDICTQRPCCARANAGGSATVSLCPGLHRRRVQHERQDPADARSSMPWPAPPRPCCTSTMRTGPVFWARTGGGRCSKLWAATKTRLSSARSRRRFHARGGSSGARRRFQRLLKIRSSSYVFGGPVVPCYLEAIGTVIDILCSSEYEDLRARLDRSIARLTRGLAALGLEVMGGATPIVSVKIGDEADTLRAGKHLFDQGYYVQSVLFPAVPYHAGVLRVQCNANHDDRAIDGLIDAFASLTDGDGFACAG